MWKRRERIVEFVNKEEQISFTQLKQEFPDISEMTLRTDLKTLDEQGLIIRIYGGARSVGHVAGRENVLSQRVEKNPELKKEIAAKAVTLLKGKSSVFIDSGSTTTLFCKMIPNEFRQIYTSSISGAAELSLLDKPNVYIPGGRINKGAVSVTGAQAVQDVQKCHFEICFLGVTSFSPDFGFCCEAKDDALLKEAAAEKSDYVVVLMDSSKFGFTNTHSFLGLDKVDAIVTDQFMSEEHKEFFKKRDILVF